MDILLHFSPFLVKVPTGYVFAALVFLQLY